MNDYSITSPWLRFEKKDWLFVLRYIGGHSRINIVTDRFYEGVVHRIWFWKILIKIRYRYIDRL